MREKFEQLLHMANQKKVTDIHFILMKHHLQVQVRGWNGLETIHNSAFDEGLFHYLKYISKLDLGNTLQPQNGNFTFHFQNEKLYFRFSLLPTLEKQTAVLRILNNHNEIMLEHLSTSQSQYQSFLNWTKMRSGLVVLSGPTGSGKTTTLHAILKKIALDNRLRVVSLEDPIEIVDSNYLQLQINEAVGFTYEEGIRELMRHDPDVIMIGEIRDPKTARMLLRSALSGHLIFSTIHAKNCSEAIKRLYEFGLNKQDLQHTLTAVTAQRLYRRKGTKERVCIYEILEKKELDYYFENQEYPPKHNDIYNEIEKAVSKGILSKEETLLDLSNINR